MFVQQLFNKSFWVANWGLVPNWETSILILFEHSICKIAITLGQSIKLFYLANISEIALGVTLYSA